MTTATITSTPTAPALPHLHEIIARIKAHGFRVFQRKPTDTWLIYTTRDGKHIAYAERDRIGTIHKPNYATCTGYSIETSPRWTEDELQRGFALAPHWASPSDLKTIVKFSGIDAYRKANPFNAEYQEV